MQRKIRTLIVDDEMLARRLIQRLLSNDVDVEVIGECANGKEAVTTIRKERPDLVFLDIQMPEMDGFAVINDLKHEYLPNIVFTTAYEQYAIRAFELHAVDYLLKPFDQERFSDMLEHAKTQIAVRETGNRRQLEALLEDLKNPPEHLERLIIKAEGRLTFVKVADINWLEADDKYVNLHLTKTTRTIRHSLGLMESQLDPKKFTRIHRSAIVNIDRIRELHAMFNGEYEAVLEDGTKLSVSRHYKDRFFKVLGRRL
jgi:two-component system, LytTR family, response regulator